MVRIIPFSTLLSTLGISDGKLQKAALIFKLESVPQFLLKQCIINQTEN